MAVPFYAKRFVSGLTLNEAVESVKPLNAEGIHVSLDILGENVASEANARQACRDYIGVVDRIAADHLKAHISIKLTMLGLDLSNELAQELLQTLLDAAKPKGVFIRIDMEGSPYTSRTLEAFLAARQKYDNVGIVLQAYLYRTKDDLERVLDVNGRVRLCKGAYREPKTIAYQDMGEIRQNYLRLAERLFERCEYPAIATHDDLLLQEVKALAAAKKRDKTTFEFQMLYGLRRPTWHDLVRQGYNMRVYVPYGEQWYPYFSRRLRERKENVLFILRNLFKS